MEAGDLPAVFAVQCAAHAVGHHESVEVLSSHWRAAPACCYVAEDDGMLLAYLFSHPWAGKPPRLHEPLPACACPDHLFIHDLAVHPAAAGRGLAAALLHAQRRALAESSLARVRLVAVRPAEGFWRRHGFRAASEQGAVDGGYGPAMLMEWWPGIPP